MWPPRRWRRVRPAAASAAVDADTVVVFFDEYALLAYDYAGEERWRLPLGPFSNIYGMGASPILVDGVVVMACDGWQTPLFCPDERFWAMRSFRSPPKSVPAWPSPHRDAR